MRRLIAAVLERIGALVPSRFRVLHRQFLLRVIDLEALSIEADIPRFLGQFCGVLIMLSFIHSFAVYFQIGQRPWGMEHYLISTMMLVAGLITVVSWDSTFPDRRDVMVLGPLPVPARMILGAKVCASASLLGIALLALNTAPGMLTPLMLGQGAGTLRALAAYWTAMIAAVLFLYCSVLTVQGLGALLLPRRMFLMLSAALQLVAFGLFISVYFLEPGPGTAQEMMAAESAPALRALPDFWFTGMFNQINGTLPPELAWLAGRAWMALGSCRGGGSLVVAGVLCAHDEEHGRGTGPGAWSRRPALESSARRVAHRSGDLLVPVAGAEPAASRGAGVLSGTGAGDWLDVPAARDLCACAGRDSH